MIAHSRVAPHNRSGWKWYKVESSGSKQPILAVTNQLRRDFFRMQVEMQAMFRGNHPARVDEKGRLKVPAEFKRVLEGKYGTRFYITSRDGQRAEVHPIEEWQKYEEKLAASPRSNAQVKRLMDRLSYYGQEVEMDAQGRVTLPQILRESAGLTGDVAVTGQLSSLEVVNLERLKQFAAEPLTPDDDQALADMGL